MSTLSQSVKFSDQPFSQNERFQVHVPELDEAANLENNGQSRSGFRSQVPPPSHNYNDEYQNSYQPPHLSNHSNYQPGASQLYSPHYAHHQRMQQYQDIEKQFNYSGSRLRSPHHNPANKISARLQQGLHLDQQYNQTGHHHHGLEGEHCPEHCEHQRSQHSLHSSQNHQLKNQSKLLLYPQPFGSGSYSNQLQKRNIHAKTGNNFYSSSGRRQVHTSQDNVRRSLHSNAAAAQTTTGNSTTFNSLQQNKRTQEKLREKLYFDERTKTVPKTTIKNGIIEDIVSEGEVFMGNKQLMNSVFKLKSLHLLKQHESHINRYNGVGKFPFVFNDYHSKSTNNGYSRQVMGGYFFTR